MYFVFVRHAGHSVLHVEFERYLAETVFVLPSNQT